MISYTCLSNKPTVRSNLGDAPMVFLSHFISVNVPLSVTQWYVNPTGPLQFTSTRRVVPGACLLDRSQPNRPLARHTQQSFYSLRRDVPLTHFTTMLKCIKSPDLQPRGSKPTLLRVQTKEPWWRHADFHEIAYKRCTSWTLPVNSCRDKHSGTRVMLAQTSFPPFSSSQYRPLVVIPPIPDDALSDQPRKR
jgi:hypothetical protein